MKYDYDYEHTPLSRYILIGVLLGFIAVVIDFFVYGLLSSSNIGASTSQIVNPFSLLYGCLVPTILGSILYYFLDNVKGGTIIYIIITFVVGVAIEYGCWHISVNDPTILHQFHILLIALFALPLLFTTFLLPYLAKNDKHIQNIL